MVTNSLCPDSSGWTRTRVSTRLFHSQEYVAPEFIEDGNKLKTLSRLESNFIQIDIFTVGDPRSGPRPLVRWIAGDLITKEALLTYGKRGCCTGAGTERQTELAQTALHMLLILFLFAHVDTATGRQSQRSTKENICLPRLPSSSKMLTFQLSGTNAT